MNNRYDIERLINDNIGLVYKAISKYYPQFLNDEDVFQVGCIGLHKAAVSYDETRAKFSTIAVMSIKREIFKVFIRDAQLQKRDIHNHTVSANIINDDTELSNLYFAHMDYGFEDVETSLIIDSIKQKLNDKECKTLDMLIAGYNQSEIAKTENVSQHSIWQRKEKIGKILLQQLA